MPGAAAPPVEVVVIDDTDDETVAEDDDTDLDYLQAENQRLRAKAAKVGPLKAALAAARAEAAKVGPLQAALAAARAEAEPLQADNERLKASEVSARAYNLWGVNSDLRNQISKVQRLLLKLRSENAELRCANAELLGKKLPLKRRLSESDADETQRSCPGLKMLRGEK